MQQCCFPLTNHLCYKSVTYNLAYILYRACAYIWACVSCTWQLVCAPEKDGFNRPDCDDFSWDQADNPFSNNSEGWPYTAAIMASLKTRRRSHPVFWRQHMFACLYVCQQPPLQWQRPWSARCWGEESLPVRHGWYDDSFHSNALVWFLCKHMKNAFWEADVCGEDENMTHSKPFQKRDKMCRSKLVRVSVG